MKKVIGLMLSLALLMMLFVTVTPVIAKTATIKSPVAGLSFLTPIGMVPPEHEWTIGNLQLSYGATVHGYNCYWINNPLPAQPWIPPVNIMTGNLVPTSPLHPDYIFYTTSEVSSISNTETGISISIWKMVMVYPIPSVGPEQGRFVGLMIVKSDGSLTTMNVVYQGSGIFNRQTLQVSGEKQGNQPGVIEGFIIIR
jgi:hypothetical protein